MMRLFISIFCFAWFSSCNHYVAPDYPQYLNNNLEVHYPKVDTEVGYVLTKKTQEHSVKIKSFTTGIANSWIVEFGKILEATMQGVRVKEAFKTIEQGKNGKSGVQIEFDLVNYAFEDHMAKISLQITATKDGKELLKKTYNENGKSQGGKMFFAGAAGMKNAIQQSTKLAMDQILITFLNDLKNNLEKTNS